MATTLTAIPPPDKYPKVAPAHVRAARSPVTESPLRMSTRLKVAAGAVLLVALAAVWFLLPVREWIEGFRDWITGLGALGVAVYALLYVVVSVALGPAWAMTLAAGLAYGLWGVPLVMVSATLAACTAFLIARYLARERVTKLVDDNRRLKALRRAVGEEGWKVVGLMRLSPVFPFGLQNYLFGITDIKLLPYALATFVGMGPGSLLYVYIGSLGSVGAGGEAGPLRWALVGAGLVATLIVVWLVTKRARATLETLDLD